MHGRCGRQNCRYGGWKTLDYPCPEHQGLRGPAAAQNIRRDGDHLWSHAPNTGVSVRGMNNGLAARMTHQARAAWFDDPNKYECDAQIRGRIGEMSASEWQAHWDRDVYKVAANGRFGPQYWADPEPWGDQREGGPRLSLFEQSVLDRENER